jgi:hypothetical protein
VTGTTATITADHPTGRGGNYERLRGANLSDYGKRQMSTLALILFGIFVSLSLSLCFVFYAMCVVSGRISRRENE